MLGVTEFISSMPVVARMQQCNYSTKLINAVISLSEITSEIGAGVSCAIPEVNIRIWYISRARVCMLVIENIGDHQHMKIYYCSNVQMADFLPYLVP